MNQFVFVDQREQIVQLRRMSRKHLKRQTKKTKTSTKEKKRKTKPMEKYLLLMRRAEQPTKTVKQLCQLPIARIARQLLTSRKRTIFFLKKKR